MQKRHCGVEEKNHRGRVSTREINPEKQIGACNLDGDHIYDFLDGLPSLSIAEPASRRFLSLGVVDPMEL